VHPAADTITGEIDKAVVDRINALPFVKLMGRGRGRCHWSVVARTEAARAAISGPGRPHAPPLVRRYKIPGSAGNSDRVAAGILVQGCLKDWNPFKECGCAAISGRVSRHKCTGVVWADGVDFGQKINIAPHLRGDGIVLPFGGYSFFPTLCGAKAPGGRKPGLFANSLR
jgi:hypothetical protein